MPGFNICGFGANPEGPSNTYEPRRKHRWAFETIGRGGGIIPVPILLVLREASRPNFKFEEPDMHHNQEQVYFAGKQSWDPCKLVWYDIEQNIDSSKEMWTWVNGVVKFQGNLPVSLPSYYKKDAILSMLKGDGSVSERWKMCGCWPKEVNWGDLNYTSTDLQTIEVSMRFDRALKQ